MFLSADQLIRSFTVSDPRRHEKGFTIYKVTSVVQKRGSSEIAEELVIWKRYSDFRNLYEELQQKHKDLCKQDQCPTFAKATFFRRFQDGVIEERRECATKLLQFIGDHPILSASNTFIKFFKNGYNHNDSLTSSTSDVDSKSGKSDMTISCESGSSFVSGVCQERLNQEDEVVKRIESWNFPSLDNLTNDISSAASDEGTCLSLTSAVGDNGRKCWSLAGVQTLPASGSQDVDFMSEAEQLMMKALNYEASGQCDAAFACLKSSISYLQMGVPGEMNSAKVNAAKNKTSMYLRIAEDLYKNLVSKSHSSVKPLAGPVTGLRYYKFLGVVGKVMLVMNINDERCHVIKVLHKSPCPVNTKKVPVLPVNVPYMVKLHTYFETDEAVFLVLQYASGGRLWELIRPKQQSQPVSPVHLAMHDNVYLGRKLIEWIPSPLPQPPASCDLAPCSPSSVTNFKHCSDSDDDNNKKQNSSLPPPLQSDETKFLASGNSISPKFSILSDSLSNSHIPCTLLSNHYDAETAHLLENAQKLLQSVSETLEMSNDESSKFMSDPFCISVSEEETESKFAKVQPWKILPQKSTIPRPRLKSSASSCDLLKNNSRHWSTPQCHFPEARVRHWAEQLILCLAELHQSGLVFRDLRPENVLLMNEDHLLLSFTCTWPYVDELVSTDAVQKLYAAPEVASIFEALPAADWWSLGALLFELVTGQPLYMNSPGNAHIHFTPTFPDFVTSEAQSFIKELLRYHPHERLGAGAAGVEEIKSHPFFADTDWDAVRAAGLQ